MTADGKDAPGMTVTLFLRGPDAERFALADLSDPQSWMLSRRMPGGASVMYVPVAIEACSASCAKLTESIANVTD